MFFFWGFLEPAEHGFFRRALPRVGGFIVGILNNRALRYFSLEIDRGPLVCTCLVSPQRLSVGSSVILTARELDTSVGMNGLCFWHGAMGSMK
jgi:hypothetical protein